MTVPFNSVKKVGQSLPPHKDRLPKLHTKGIYELQKVTLDKWEKHSAELRNMEEILNMDAQKGLQ